VRLSVSCDAPVPERVAAVRDLMLRLGPPYDAYRVGATEPLTVGVELDRLTPRPTEANLVELDDEGDHHRHDLEGASAGVGRG
jgi:hypothetical protein